MSEDKTNYKEIWQSWLKTVPFDPDERWRDQFELQEFLEKSFESKEPAIQQELLETMLNVVLSQDYAHVTALYILEKRATTEHRKKLRDFYFCKLKSAKTPQDEWYLKMLVDALSYETTDEFLNIIEDYLLYRPYGIIWIYPSDELLKTHPDLYLRGWTRFFKERTFEKGKTNIIFQGFLAKPQMILALKQYMTVNSPNAWENFKTILLYAIDNPTSYRIDKTIWPSQELREKSKQVIFS